jgi:acetoin utilization deacetylase AcuC-like enzyme
MTTPHPEPRAGASRAAIFRSEVFRAHDTGAHPENAGRLVAIDAALEQLDLLRDRPDVPFTAASDEALARVHDPRYIEGLREFAAQGGGWLDADTAVSPASFDVAALAAGAGIAAVDASLEARARRGFVLARPPGHHATPTRGMGFCLFNTAAVATRHALSRGLERVLIVDWDVHHGNGTQEVFYDTDEVLYCSLHQWPHYPGTGSADERGRGRGEGYTINVPLAAGAGDETYLEVFDRLILPAARAYQPQLVLISAGFDAHAGDPLASMRLSTPVFGAFTRRLLEVADRDAEGRLVAVLEGGYDPQALAESVVATLVALDGENGSLHGGAADGARQRDGDGQR